MAAPKQQDMQVKFISVEIVPDRVEEFLNVMDADATGSRSEAGCVCFHVLKDTSAENKFFLYEAYVDSDAAGLHKETQHFKLWADFKASGGVLSQAITQYGAVNVK